MSYVHYAISVVNVELVSEVLAERIDDFFLLHDLVSQKQPLALYFQHSNTSMHYLALVDNLQLILVIIQHIQEHPQNCDRIKDLINQKNKAGKTSIDFANSFNSQHYLTILDHLAPAQPTTIPPIQKILPAVDNPNDETELGLIVQMSSSRQEPCNDGSI